MKILILANNDIGLYQFRKELIAKLLEEHEVYISLPYGAFIEPLEKAGCRFIDTRIDRMRRKSHYRFQTSETVFGHDSENQSGACYYIYHKAEYLWGICLRNLKKAICS